METYGTKIYGGKCEKIWKNVWGNQICQADMEKKHVELMGTRWTALEKS